MIVFIKIFVISVFLVTHRPNQARSLMCDSNKVFLSFVCVRLTNMMTAVAFWKNSSFAECVLREISSGCVDTKLRGIEATCKVSDDRG